MQIKKRIGGLPTCILLKPHSFWIGESNHKKILHLLASPNIELGSQLPHKKTINHTWAPLATAEGRLINTRKVHAFRTRSRARPVPTIHSVRKHQYCLLQDSGSFWENVYTPNRKVTSHIKQREISISWSLTITTQTQSMLNPSRQDQAWIYHQRTKISTAC